MTVTLASVHADIRSHLGVVPFAAESVRVGTRIAMLDAPARDKAWSIVFGQPQTTLTTGRLRWVVPVEIHWSSASGVDEADSYADAVAYQSSIIEAFLLPPFEGWTLAGQFAPDAIRHESDEAGLTYLGIIRTTITFTEIRS